MTICYYSAEGVGSPGRTLLTLQTSLYVYQLVETRGASSSSGDGELERMNVLCSMDFDLSSFDVKKVASFGATFLYWFR